MTTPEAFRDRLLKRDQKAIYEFAMADSRRIRLSSAYHNIPTWEPNDPLETEWFNAMIHAANVVMKEQGGRGNHIALLAEGETYTTLMVRLNDVIAVVNRCYDQAGLGHRTVPEILPQDVEQFWGAAMVNRICDGLRDVMEVSLGGPWPADL